MIRHAIKPVKVNLVGFLLYDFCHVSMSFFVILFTQTCANEIIQIIFFI